MTLRGCYPRTSNIKGPQKELFDYKILKISVGGVNALTGLSQKENAIGKQNYLAVGGRNGQL